MVYGYPRKAPSRYDYVLVIDLTIRNNSNSSTRRYKSINQKKPGFGNYNNSPTPTNRFVGGRHNRIQSSRRTQSSQYFGRPDTRGIGRGGRPRNLSFDDQSRRENCEVYEKKGVCGRSKCRHNHRPHMSETNFPKNLNREPCSFFKAGSCSKGEKCTFMHLASPSSSSPQSNPPKYSPLYSFSSQEEVHVPQYTGISQFNQNSSYRHQDYKDYQQNQQKKKTFHHHQQQQQKKKEKKTNNIVCIFHNSSKGCNKGEKCPFKHLNSFIPKKEEREGVRFHQEQKQENIVFGNHHHHHQSPKEEEEEKISFFGGKRQQKQEQQQHKKKHNSTFGFIVGQNHNGLKFAYSDALQVSNKLRSYPFHYECTELLYKNKNISNKCLTYSKFRKSFIKFTQKLNQGDTVFFYFSGHGYQYKGENYLQCVKNREDLEDMKLSFLIKTLRDRKTKNIFILDCCQDDSSNLTWKSAGGGQGQNGPSQHHQPLGNIHSFGSSQFVFGYACLPGTRTIEKCGGGIFTKSVLKYMSPKDEINVILRKANSDMFQNEQRQGIVISTALEDLYI